MAVFGFFIYRGVFLVLIGAIDDGFLLGVFMRVLSDVMVTIALIELLNLRTGNPDETLVLGLIKVNPVLAYPFSVIAILGIVDSFNGPDGIDGLL